ncbi:MAG TPA: hypothetical protein VGF59_20795 [Bryobacteraceae bacterium]|jgi:hypothetical protein
MIRKAYILGVLAAALTATVVRTTPAYGKLAASAQNFRESYCDLKRAGNSLSPVERFVFSLVLAHTRPEAASQTPAPRT